MKVDFVHIIDGVLYLAKDGTGLNAMDKDVAAIPLSKLVTVDDYDKTLGAVFPILYLEDYPVDKNHPSLLTSRLGRSRSIAIIERMRARAIAMEGQADV